MIIQNHFIIWDKFGECKAFFFPLNELKVFLTIILLNAGVPETSKF